MGAGTGRRLHRREYELNTHHGSAQPGLRRPPDRPAARPHGDVRQHGLADRTTSCGPSSARTPPAASTSPSCTPCGPTETHVYFAPPFGPRNPWWWSMPPVSAWIGRVMELARGTSAARTALLQPQRAARAVHDDGADGRGRRRLRGRRVRPGTRAGRLRPGPRRRPQRRPWALAHAETDGGLLRVGRAAYELVVVPATPVLDTATVRTLTALRPVRRHRRRRRRTGRARRRRGRRGARPRVRQAVQGAAGRTGRRAGRPGRRRRAPRPCGPPSSNPPPTPSASCAPRAAPTPRSCSTTRAAPGSPPRPCCPHTASPSCGPGHPGTVGPAPVRGLPTGTASGCRWSLDPYETLAVVVTPPGRRRPVRHRGRRPPGHRRDPGPARACVRHRPRRTARHPPPHRPRRRPHLRGNRRVTDPAHPDPRRRRLDPHPRRGRRRNR